MNWLQRAAQIVLLTGFTLANSVQPVWARGDEQKVVTASEGRVKLPSAGENSARAFVVVDNPTMYDIYVVSAATDVAAAVQFREVMAASGANPSVVRH